MTVRPPMLFDRATPSSDWAMTARVRRFGFALALVWLALVASITAPLIGARHLLAMASLDAAAICFAAADDAPAAPHPQGVPDDMADCCNLALPQAPVLAQLDGPAIAHTPRLIGRAWPDLLPQLQTPPGMVWTAAYPRGPPISI